MTETTANAKVDLRSPASDQRVRIGAIVGFIMGAALGCVYALIPEPKLQLGPIPGWAVGLLFGGAFGVVLGAFAGSAGRQLLSGRAAMGFLIAVAIIVLGRLSDDSGSRMDKIMDIVVGGIGWGVFGALVGASLSSAETKKESN